MHWRIGGDAAIEINKIRHPVTNLGWKLAKVDFILFFLTTVKAARINMYANPHMHPTNRDKNEYQPEVTDFGAPLLT